MVPVGGLGVLLSSLLGVHLPLLDVEALMKGASQAWGAAVRLSPWQPSPTLLSLKGMRRGRAARFGQGGGGCHWSPNASFIEQVNKPVRDHGPRSRVYLSQFAGLPLDNKECIQWLRRRVLYEKNGARSHVGNAFRLITKQKCKKPPWPAPVPSNCHRILSNFNRSPIEVLSNSTIVKSAWVGRSKSHLISNKRQTASV